MGMAEEKIWTALWCCVVLGLASVVTLWPFFFRLLSSVASARASGCGGRLQRVVLVTDPAETAARNPPRPGLGILNSFAYFLKAWHCASQPRAATFNLCSRAAPFSFCVSSAA